MSSFHHRSVFAGKNKPFKGKSKGKIKRLTKGKVDSASDRTSVKSRGRQDRSQTRENRRNHARQIQRNRRDDILQAKRIGGRGGPPRIIAIIPISAGANVIGIRECILKRANGSKFYNGEERQYTTSIKVDGRDRGLIFLDPQRDPVSVLDAAKIADVIVPVIECTGDSDGFKVNSLGDHLVTLLKAQGLPSVVGVTTIATEMQIKPKTLSAAQRLCKRWFNSVFESPRVVNMDGKEANTDQLLRHIASIKLNDIAWRSRPYLLAEAVDFRSGPNSIGTLRVKGFLRGPKGLSAKQLVHITGLDDFQVTCIQSASSNSNVEKKSISAMQEEKDDLKSNILSTSAPQERESLISLNPVDATAENIITEEELKEAEVKSKQKRAPPAGVDGMIEDVWRTLVSDDEDDEAEQALLQHIRDQEAEGVPKEEDIDDGNGLDLENDATLQRLQSSKKAEEKRKKPKSLEEMRTEAQEEAEFPDEVEINPETVARTRFAKFRGLKSFRTSDWDPKQNLPPEYAQIFQFQDFAAARRRVLQAEGGGCGGPEALPGREVIIEIEGVSERAAVEMKTATRPIMIWGLYQYERKVSVSHFLVKRHENEDSEPVRGKAPMVFSVGFRRFIARPIYSQDCKSNKFKVDRFLHPGVWAFASVYSRMLLTSATCLLFRASEQGVPVEAGSVDGSAGALSIEKAMEGPLVASGTLASIDPDRLLIKRVLLTGAPISVSKRMAVVRHMFYKPEDVRWFKPVELYTKHGLIGHILDAHGTKGYMKCNFDGHIKNHDTVCMSLYKRQYPPFNARNFEAGVSLGTQGS
ncbi:hypothetical protein AAMO2058_001200300 [Amorphochlora amoebiformis]